MQNFLIGYERGKQKICLVVNLIVLLGFILEFINYSEYYSASQFTLQLSTSFLLVGTLILFLVDKKRFFALNYLVISYSVIVNIVLSLIFFQDFYEQLSFTKSEFFSRDMLFVMALIALVGFIGSKRHIVLQGSLLGIFVSYELLVIGDSFIIESAALYYLISAGFCWVMFFLVNNLNMFIGKLEENNSQINDLHEGALVKKNKLEAYTKATIKLSNSIQFDKTQLNENVKSFEEILNSVAENLGCTRVSIWLFSKDKRQINRDVLVEDGVFKMDQRELEAKDYPEYFNSLLTQPFIAIEDVFTAVEMKEFTETYLNSSDARALLDVPIKINNVVLGIISSENQYKARSWENEDILYAQSVADLIAIQLKDMEVKDLMSDLESSNDKLQSSIKKLNTTQAQLVQSEKMASLGLLASGVAHEINNPLNFISGGAEYLKMFFKKHYSNRLEEVQPAFDGIFTGLKRAISIVNSLGHYSKSNDNVFTKCDIHEIIEDSLVILNSQLQNRIKIEKNFSKAKDYSIKGNEGKLHQVFLNILSNAEQAIAKEGRIFINTTVKSKVLRVEIVDSGTGISKTHLNQIFDPFFTTKGVQATGLGLSIAYAIIKDHNGSIAFNSTIDIGTTVTISFPMKG